MFDKMKQVFEMQRKMQELKRTLDQTTFEVQSPDGSLKLVMNGSQEVREVSIIPGLDRLEKEKLEGTIKDTCNRALKRSHDLAAEKMKELTGLNLPGLA